IGCNRERLVLYGVRKSHLLTQPHHALAARAASKIVNLHHGRTSVPSVGMMSPSRFGSVTTTPTASAARWAAARCEGDKPVSTSSHESCKNLSHELVQRRRTFRSSRLSPWQSERGLDPRRPGIDRAEGTCRLHLRGSCPLGRSESGGALPAFSRPRRTVDRRGTARLRSIRGYAGERLGRRLSGCLLSVRPSRQSLPPIRKERAGLLFRHVRGRHPARSEPRITGSGAACLYRVADRHRAARRSASARGAGPTKTAIGA